MMSDLESNIVAVERVKEYSKTETEVSTGMSLGQGDSGIAGWGRVLSDPSSLCSKASSSFGGGSSFIYPST